MEIGWTDVGSGGYILVSCAHRSNNSGTAKVKIVKNERNPPLFTGKQLIKFQNILRNTIQVIIRHRICLQTDGHGDTRKRGGSLSFLVGTISNVLVMEIGWTDVGSGGYILVSCAHSNTSFN
jgi:hypothetical protein